MGDEEDRWNDLPFEVDSQPNVDSRGSGYLQKYEKPYQKKDMIVL